VGGPGVRNVVVVRLKLVSLVCGLFPVSSVANEFLLLHEIRFNFFTTTRNAFIQLHEMRFLLLYEMRFNVWGGWGGAGVGHVSCRQRGARKGVVG